MQFLTQFNVNTFILINFNFHFHLLNNSNKIKKKYFSYYLYFHIFHIFHIFGLYSIYFHIYIFFKFQLNYLTNDRPEHMYLQTKNQS